MIYDFLWLIPFLPLLAFAVMFGITYENKRTSAWLGIGAALGADLVAIILLFAEIAHKQPYHVVKPIFDQFISFGTPPLDFTLQVGVLADPLAAMMAVVVCTVSALIQIYSLEYMRGEEGFVRFFGFISLFTFSMLFLVFSPNFFQTYIGWELVGVCSYLLIGHYYKRPAAAAAAKKAFIVTRFGDFAFLVGIGYIYARFHSLDFYQLSTMWTVGKVSSVGLFIMAMLVFSGAVGKSAQFPLHVWLPDAMEGPTPISALIHAATMVAAGVYLVARTYDLFAANTASLAVVATLGAITSLMAAIWAVAQDDIKRIVAYSTLSHLGLMMLGLGVGAYSAALFHLFTHAWFKALLFLAAGSVIHSLHTQDIWEMGGLWKRMPVTAWTMLIGCLSAAGIPIFSGFFSKDAIVAAVFAQGNPVLTAMAVLISFFSALYIFRLFFVVFTGEPAKRRAFDPKRIHENGRAIVVPMVVLAALAGVIGLVASVTLKGGFGGFVFFGSRAETESVNYIAMGASILIALLGLLTATLFYHARLKRFSAAEFNQRFAPVYAWAHNKGWFDEIYEALFVRGLLITSGRAVQWFDSNIIDFFLDSLAGGYQLLATRARRLQTGRVQGYALGLFAGVFVLAVLFIIFGGGGALAAVGR